MTRPDSNLSVPPGERSGGSSYHLSFRSGSRSGGACARAAHAYITRSDEYDDLERDPAVYTESEHMPAWAQDDPREYWDAADLYERANGRLYVSADFALPRDLSAEDQVALARSFARELTADERLPYTLAIHAGRDADGRDHNPHAHLMISERRNDEIERSKERWFRRADRAEPERGGAPKSRTFHGREWMENARERWAELTNDALRRAGRDERVDHRSYARQGVDREPGHHYGPAAAHMVSRGASHEPLEREVERGDVRTRIDELDRQLELLVAERARTADRGRAAHEVDTSRDARVRQRTAPDRDRSSSPER
jgi:MobA/MobL family